NDFPEAAGRRPQLRGAIGLRSLAGLSILPTHGQTHRQRSPRACARCAERALFGYSCFSAHPHLSCYIGGAKQIARPRVASPKHGSETPRRCGTVRILRIASGQVSVVCAPRGRHRNGSHSLRGGWGWRLLQWYGPSVVFRASGGMADALASGASVLRDVGVQVPLRPPKALPRTAFGELGV